MRESSTHRLTSTEALPAAPRRRNPSSADCPVWDRLSRPRESSVIMTQVRLKRAAILIATTLLMVFLYGRIEYAKEPFSEWDLSSYRAMANSSPRLNPDVPWPFAYRLLGPYIIGLLPVPDPLGFYLSTVAVSVPVIVLLYLFLCDVGLSANASAITALLLSFNARLFGFLIWDYFQISDFLSLLCVLILFWAMIRGHWVVFGLALLLGALTREAPMLLAPVAFFYLLEKKRLATEGRYASLAVIPGVVAFLFLRMAVPAPGGSLLNAFTTHAAKVFSAKDCFDLLVDAFVPLSLAPLVFIETTVEFFRKRKYAAVFVALVLFSTLFGSNNERLMAPAFIVFYWLIGVIIDDGILKSRRLMLLVVLCAFISSFHYEISRFHFMDKRASIALSLSALALVTGACILFRLRRTGIESRGQRAFEKTGPA